MKQKLYLMIHSMSISMIRIIPIRKFLYYLINEHRYIIIGLSLKNRLLIVAYAERKNKVRLISAREATRREQKVYEEG